MDVCVEAGSKKTFASALDWPGWSRSARDEAGALEALVVYGRRYAAVLKGSVSGFKAPKDISALRVIERLPGSSSTDFGVPDRVAKADGRPLDARELARLCAILRACWATFDATAASAKGIELRKGPRGGGRELEKIRSHVLEGEWSYLKSIGGTPPKIGDVTESLDAMHAAFLDALERRVAGSIPEQGPRGRVYWPPRYGVRRAAWHVLDHAWEIEDRAR